MTLKDTPNAISSPVSEGGQLPYAERCGQTADLFGREAALASRFPLPVNKRGRTMTAIYGPSGSALPPSVARQLSLESKLAVLFPTDGSTECNLTWRACHTLSGRRYCQLVPSMRPINETDCGLWHTPRSTMIEESPEKFRARMNSKRPNDRKEGMAHLAMQAATWATPNTMDGMDARSPEAMKHQFSDARKGRTAPANLRERVIPELYPQALWPTPKTQNAQTPAAHGQGGLGLQEVACGITRNGSSAETIKSGASPQLNPAFVSWLMGYSTKHHSSMLSAMQSYRKLRRGSSKRVCKEESK